MLNLLKPGTPFPEEFPKGAVLLVDKPLGWSSFDVVNKIRYLLSRRLGVRKIKIGHAGTLDPLATGLLILCVGEYTKKIESFQGMAKEYTGVITFGATTPSYDKERPIDATYPTGHLNDAFLQSLLPQFTGEIQQLPPAFSAVKVDGRRLYKDAHAGQEVTLTPRTITIEAIALGPLRPVPGHAKDEEMVILNKKGAPIRLHPDYPEGLQCDFRVVCGKGTYIRSLAHDLGRAAGCGAYLSSLRRTRNGGFSVDDAWTVEALATWIGG